jgi:hypothetical protein
VLNVARYDVDKLRAALLEGDAARCARLLEGLRGEDVAPPLLLWAFASEIRTLAALRAAQDEGRPLAAALRAERVFGDRAPSPCSAPCSGCAHRKLRAALLAAARIDRMIKGLVQGDVWDEFLQLALRLARKAAPGIRLRSPRQPRPRRSSGIDFSFAIPVAAGRADLDFGRKISFLLISDEVETVLSLGVRVYPLTVQLFSSPVICLAIMPLPA